MQDLEFVSNLWCDIEDKNKKKKKEKERE